MATTKSAKTATKKVVAKKAPVKKAVAKKTPVKKTVVKKSAAKKTIGYTTSNVFKESIKKVWEAAVEAKHLKKHFVDDMKGEFGVDLKPVSWYWKEWDWLTITPKVFKKYEQIVWDTQGMDGVSKITITFDFLEKDGKTIFRISEAGYPADKLKDAFMMCEGWTEFHCGVKAYLMNGTVLNK